jgi:hypothetical protein
MPRSMMWLAVAVLAMAGAQAESFFSRAQNFGAAFPCKTRVAGQQVRTALGDIPTITYSCETGSNVFYVAVSTYPKGFIAKRTVAAASQDAIAGAAENVKGHVRNNIAAKLGKQAGRDALIDVASQKTVVHLRVFFAGDRQYQVMYLGPAGTETGKPAMAFLGSFWIGK